MLRTCIECGRRFKTGEDVILTVCTKWKELKSTIIESIDKPWGAEETSIVHFNCKYPLNETSN